MIKQPDPLFLRPATPRSHKKANTQIIRGKRLGRGAQVGVTWQAAYRDAGQKFPQVFARFLIGSSAWHRGRCGVVGPRALTSCARTVLNEGVALPRGGEPRGGKNEGQRPGKSQLEKGWKWNLRASQAAKSRAGFRLSISLSFTEGEGGEGGSTGHESFIFYISILYHSIIRINVVIHYHPKSLFT